MARSFYYGTDLSVSTGAIHFSQAINLSPETYGVSVEDAEAYALLAQAYADSLTVALAPETRTVVALSEKEACRRALVVASARLAKAINGNAAVSEIQKIALGLAVGRTPVPETMLGSPERITCSLAQIGTLTLKWNCTHPTRASGVIYLVSRRNGDAGEFVPIGFTGKKSFVDATIPAGAAAVTYRVQAARSTAVGEPALYTANFTARNLPADAFKPIGRALQHAA